MSTTKQELQEQLLAHMVLLYGDSKRCLSELDSDERKLVEHLTEFITAHTNAEIANTLDRLELGMRGKTIVDTPEGWKRFVKIYVNDAIEAERAKLKEVKLR